MQEFTDYAVLEIPVVVHVFHYYSAGRLTAESIAAQIDVRSRFTIALISSRLAAGVRARR